jgi:L-fuculose-phosphate aldolase
MLLANHGAVTCGDSATAAYHKMETIEHFAKISLVARLLGREHLISRHEVERLQGLRGTYGIAAPAPLCTDPNEAAAADQVLCQVLEAPESASDRLVPDLTATLSGLLGGASGAPMPASGDREIRLTYAELTALIADAVKNIRDS